MDIFLKVDITVQPDEQELAAFQRGIEAFLATGFMKRRHWDLFGGFQKVEQGYVVSPEGYSKAQTTSADRVRGKQFLNLWSLPAGFSTRDIADIMLELADVSSYVELDSHVSIEVQEAVTRVNEPIIPPESVAGMRKEGLFACVRHYIDRKKLAKFALSSGALARDWMGRYSDMTFLGTYQDVTGLLNVFWDFWRIPPNMKLADFEKRLAELILTSDPVSQTYRDAIQPDAGPLTRNSTPDHFHDGLDVLRAAPYWSLA
jgi:hypothetical protein